MTERDNQGTSRRSRQPQQVRCPTCRAYTTYQGNPWRPFCSERCQTIDKAAWAEESFRVAGPFVLEDVQEDE